MTLAYNEQKMIYEMVMLAIANGNRAEGKLFDPTPEQYRMLCDVANRLEDSIELMQKRYGLQ